MPIALVAFHMKCQPQILGIRWSDLVSNVNMQARTGLTPLGEILVARRISVFPRDAMHKRGLCRHAVSVCLCVSVSVTFVSCVETNKHIIKIFFTVG